MLQLEHVKKSYDGVTILEDISLDIEDGEIVSNLRSLRMRKDDAFKSDPGNYGK